MSATMMLIEMTKMVAEATAIIARMNEAMPAIIAAANAEKTPLVAPKTKKPASKGTMAWQAFVSHAQLTQPERFVGLNARKDVLCEAKVIRNENEEVYTSFIAEWKVTQTSLSLDTESIPEESVEMPSPKEKKKVAAGTMAWHAFVQHCNDTMPEMLSEASSYKERIQLIKVQKQNDPDGYDMFVSEWKETQPVLIA
jgi:hypothetical protein